VERKILGAFLSSRGLFAAAYPHVEVTDLSPEARLILDKIREYYDLDPKATACDREILTVRLRRVLQSDKQFELIRDVLISLPCIEDANVAKEVIDLKRYNIGLKLAQELIAGKDAGRLVDDYYALSNTNIDRKEQEEEVAPSIKGIVDTDLNKDNLIKVLPLELNRRIGGGVRPGHHIIVFAPVEMGKTLLTINMVAGFLHQNRKVLYIANEEPSHDIVLRLVGRLSGMNKDQILGDPDEAEKRALKHGYGNFVIAPLAPGNFYTIHGLVDRHGPACVVLDQLRNIDVKSENRTQALEKAATEARNLAKSKQVVVVSVTQAADSANNKRNLGRGDIDSSNVGIPAQGDLIIGIGADAEMEARGLRQINLIKNKLSGNHEPFTCTFNTMLSKVEE
jgi:DnaB-like helicase C terminal domain